MNKNFQNTLIFILLVVGLVTFIVDVWTADRAKETPEEVTRELEDWLSEDVDDFPQPEETAEPLDLEALREEIREEVLAQLQADLNAQPTPEPQPEPERPEEVVELPAPTPTPVVEPGPEVAEPVEKASEVPEVNLAAMQSHIQALERRVSAMKVYLRDEERALREEQSRILSWKRELRTKYADETFSVTKTRAEQRQVQLAISSWKSRQRRQLAREQVLEETEADLAWKKDRLREMKRR